MQKSKNKRHKEGINIIEIVIVIAIISIITAVVISQFFGMKKVQVLKSASQDVFSSINKAKSQTLASLDSSEYGVHFQSDKVVLFKGTIFSEEDVNNIEYEIISPATISDISLTGGVDDLFFNRLSGTPNVSGSITLSVPGSEVKIITISGTGVVSLN